MNVLKRGYVAAAAGTALLAATCASAQVSLQVVLYDNGPVPGLPGAYSAQITGSPRIGANGSVMIPVELAGPGITSGVNSSTILTGTPGALAVAASSGMVVPGAAPNALVSLSTISTSAADGSQASASITVTDPDTFDFTSAYYAVRPGTSSLTPDTPLRFYGVGDHAPAPLAAATISSAQFPSFSSSHGFAGFAVLSGGGITATSNQVLLTGAAGGPPTIAAHQSDPAPGIPTSEPGGPAYLFLREQNAININAAGQILFRASLVNSSGSSIPFNPSALYRYQPGGTLLLVAREGSASGSGSLTFGAQVTNDSVSINSSGNVAFQTQQGAGSGSFVVWGGTPGSLVPLAQSGAAAPGLPAGVSFATTNGFSNAFTGLRLADTNAAAFIATLSGAGVTGSNSRAIYTGTPGALQLVARLGDAAPGAPTGATFTGFSTLALSASGRVVFAATDSQGPVTPGVWARTGSGATQKVIRPGDTLTINGAARSVSSVSGLATGTGADGLPCSIAASGSLLLQVGLTDGTSAVVLARLGPVADFNSDGAITVQDIFDFLNAWFAGSPSADINGGGLSVQDIFDFLTHWFAGT